MVITKQNITEFKALYKKHFNANLDDKTAKRKLTDLLVQMEIIHNPTCFIGPTRKKESTKNGKSSR